MDVVPAKPEFDVRTIKNSTARLKLMSLVPPMISSCVRTIKNSTARLKLAIRAQPGIRWRGPNDQKLDREIETWRKDEYGIAIVVQVRTIKNSTARLKQAKRAEQHD